jgi:hypothetical protein
MKLSPHIVRRPAGQPHKDVRSTEITISSDRRFLLQHRDAKVDIWHPDSWSLFVGSIEPSAKILVSATFDEFISAPPYWICHTPARPTLARRAAVENKICGFGKGRNDVVRFIGPVLLIAIVNEDSQTTGRPASADVAPAVADDVAFWQVDGMLSRRGENHAGFRLAASALIRIDVEADLDVIDGEFDPNQFVHRLDGRPRRATGGYIRLIRTDDDEIARLFEPTHRILDARQETELSESGWCHRFAVTLEIGVDHAVTIEKDGWPHHLVAFRCGFR